MKEKLHIGHLGVNACLRRARNNIFWPRMSSDIREYIECCDTCAVYSDKQLTTPFFVRKAPNYTWQAIASDIFTLNQHDYLINVDYFSQYFDVDIKINLIQRLLFTKTYIIVLALEFQ